MRTTITLEADVAKELQKLTRQSGRAFKDVVNELLRRGILVKRKEGKPKPFVLKAKACGFKAGVDPTKLNQLLDELEADDFISDVVREASRSPK